MTFSILAVVFASIRSLYTCVPMPNASPSFPSLCGFFGHGSWLLPGEFDFLQLFRGILMHSKLCVGLLESSAVLCVHVHAPDVSIGLSSLFGSPCAVLHIW